MESLTDQRRLYLYLLYRKWRGEGFYGTPYEIVNNCHPYPTNWNGKALINRLMKDKSIERSGSFVEHGTTKARYRKTGVQML